MSGLESTNFGNYANLLATFKLVASISTDRLADQLSYQQPGAVFAPTGVELRPGPHKRLRKCKTQLHPLRIKLFRQKSARTESRYAHKMPYWAVAMAAAFDAGTTCNTLANAAKLRGHRRRAHQSSGYHCTLNAEPTTGEKPGIYLRPENSSMVQFSPIFLSNQGFGHARYVLETVLGKLYSQFGASNVDWYAESSLGLDVHGRIAWCNVDITDRVVP